MREANQVLEDTRRAKAAVSRDVEELPDEVSPANPMSDGFTPKMNGTLTGLAKREKREFCDDADAVRPWKHEAPFYRVELVAIECGPGSRQRSHKREIKRTILRKLCANCYLNYNVQYQLIYRPPFYRPPFSMRSTKFDR